MKTNFCSRPVYLQTESHIKAHFMICYTALLLYRLMEAKLDDYCKTLKDSTIHLTTDNIIETLQHMEVANVQDMYYLSTYTGSQTLNALEAVFDLSLDRKYYQPSELNKKLKKIL